MISKIISAKMAMVLANASPAICIMLIKERLKIKLRTSEKMLKMTGVRVSCMP